jgi:hypothetical protein
VSVGMSLVFNAALRLREIASVYAGLITFKSVEISSTISSTRGGGSPKGRQVYGNSHVRLSQQHNPERESDSCPQDQRADTSRERLPLKSHHEAARNAAVGEKSHSACGHRTRFDARVRFTVSHDGQCKCSEPHGWGCAKEAGKLLGFKPSARDAKSETINPPARNRNMSCAIRVSLQDLSH